MKRVLTDASSAILLFKAGLVDELLDIYRILMTKVVYEELTPNGYPGAQFFRSSFAGGRLEILFGTSAHKLTSHFESGLSGLDRGERDTIRQYLTGAGDFILIDDGKGAGYCRKNRIPYINALLVPRILYFCHRFSEVEYQHKVANVIQNGRYSPEVIEFGLNCTRRQLDFFLP